MDEAIWLEKYRPQTLEQVVGNAPIVSKLQGLARYKNMPNLILTGPPGCGKTTSVLALCREVLGQNFRSATLELNASDERGIEVVRDKIKTFAERKIKLPSGQHKVIILDEADSLTDAAQQALRMVVSNFSESTRFVFSCNDSAKIIEPIQSRCAVLRFARLSDQDVLEFLLRVCREEGVEYEKEGLNTLVFVADGDMRNAVNNLQAVWIARREITREGVFQICDVPRIGDLSELFQRAGEGDLEGALEVFERVWESSPCVHDLVNYLARIVERAEELKYSLRFRFMEKIADLRVRDAMGLSSKIQLLGTIAELCEIGKEHCVAKLEEIRK